MSTKQVHEYAWVEVTQNAITVCTSQVMCEEIIQMLRSLDPQCVVLTPHLARVRLANPELWCDEIKPRLREIILRTRPGADDFCLTTTVNVQYSIHIAANAGAL